LMRRPPNDTRAQKLRFLRAYILAEGPCFRKKRHRRLFANPKRAARLNR
jgi:hypothetical protein